VAGEHALHLVRPEAAVMDDGLDGVAVEQFVRLVVGVGLGHQLGQRHRMVRAGGGDLVSGGYFVVGVDEKVALEAVPFDDARYSALPVGVFLAAEIGPGQAVGGVAVGIRTRVQGGGVAGEVLAEIRHHRSQQPHVAVEYLAQVPLSRKIRSKNRKKTGFQKAAWNLRGMGNARAGRLRKGDGVIGNLESNRLTTSEQYL